MGLNPVTIIIPGSGCPDLTVRCLEAIQENNPQANVLYVDNGSSAADLTQIERSGFPVRVIGFPDNRGFTAAINAGLSDQVSPVGSDYLLLNNDCFLLPGVLTKLQVHLANNPTYAAVGPLAEGPGWQSIRRGSRPRRFARAVNLLDICEYDHAARIVGKTADGELHSCGMLAFFCTLIRGAALADVGLLDPRFADGLGADDDWCNRALARGWKLGLAADALVIHLGRQSFKRLSLPRNCAKAMRKLRQKARSD